MTKSLEQNPSWDANRFAANQEIPRISWKPNVHYRIQTRPPAGPCPEPDNPVHTSPSPPLEDVLIFFPSTHGSSKWSLSLGSLRSQLCVHMHLYLCAYIYIYIYMCVCVCVYVCMYVYIYECRWNSKSNTMCHDRLQHDLPVAFFCHLLIALSFLRGKIRRAFECYLIFSL